MERSEFLFLHLSFSCSSLHKLFHRCAQPFPTSPLLVSSLLPSLPPSQGCLTAAYSLPLISLPRSPSTWCPWEEDTVLLPQHPHVLHPPAAGEASVCPELCKPNRWGWVQSPYPDLTTSPAGRKANHPPFSEQPAASRLRYVVLLPSARRHVGRQQSLADQTGLVRASHDVKPWHCTQLREFTHLFQVRPGRQPHSTAGCAFKCLAEHRPKFT